MQQKHDRGMNHMDHWKTKLLEQHYLKTSCVSVLQPITQLRSDFGICQSLLFFSFVLIPILKTVFESGPITFIYLEQQNATKEIHFKWYLSADLNIQRIWRFSLKSTSCKYNLTFTFWLYRAQIIHILKDTLLCFCSSQSILNWIPESLMKNYTGNKANFCCWDYCITLIIEKAKVLCPYWHEYIGRFWYVSQLFRTYIS